MKGFAVIIRRDDGSHYFTSGVGLSTSVWFEHESALEFAKELRRHGASARVVKVEYTDPAIIGPKRFLEKS